jgi:hypothetical protein
VLAKLAVVRFNGWLSKASVQTKVNLAPLKVRISTKDERSAFATIRPLAGNKVSRSVLGQLHTYVESLDSKEIRRTTRLEYRDGKWGDRRARASRRNSR